MSMRTYFVDEEDFETYQTTAPDPIPVGHSRTRTVRFDDPPQVMARRHRRILYALAMCADSAAFIVWLIAALPHHLEHAMSMPAFVGLPLGILLGVVWLGITFLAVNDVWPHAANGGITNGYNQN